MRAEAAAAQSPRSCGSALHRAPRQREGGTAWASRGLGSAAERHATAKPRALCHAPALRSPALAMQRAALRRLCSAQRRGGEAKVRTDCIGFARPGQASAELHCAARRRGVAERRQTTAAPSVGNALPRAGVDRCAALTSASSAAAGGRRGAGARRRLCNDSLAPARQRGASAMLGAATLRLGYAQQRQGPASTRAASAEESDPARRQGKARLASRRPREAARGAAPVQADGMPTERQTPPQTARERARGAERTKGENVWTRLFGSCSRRWFSPRS